MPSEPGPPASPPASLHRGAEDSVGEIETPASWVQIETPLSTSSTAATQASAIERHAFLPEDGDANADRAVTSDTFDLLSLYFSSEADAYDITQEPFDGVIPAGTKTAKSESAAFADQRLQVQQTELAIKQSVEDVGTLKIELAQLAEVAVRLTGECSRIEEATRTVEERSVAAANSQSAALADLRGQLQQTELGIKQSVGDAGAFKTELAQLGEVAVRLTGEYSHIEEATRTVEERSTAALEIVNAIETRLSPLAMLQDLSRRTDERLAALNVLAGQVTRKAEALESQEDKINSALEKGNGVAEIVSAMEARIAKLDNANQLIELAEEMLGRLERLAGEATSQLAQVTKVKNEVESDLARFEKRVQTLSESARTHVEEFVLQKERLGAFNSRPNPAHADWGSLSRWLTQVMAVLRTQKTPRLTRHHRAVIGALGVLVLASVIVARSLGDSDQIGSQAVVTHAPPVLAASPLVLPEMMLRSAVPILPQTMLGPAGPMVRTDNPSAQPPATAQSLVKAESLLSPPRVDAQLPQTSVRSPEFIGTLEVQSDPAGAAVFINRQRVGETPLQLPQLRAGSHVIWIESEGYERWTAAARVVADTVSRIDVKLQPLPARSGIP